MQTSVATLAQIIPAVFIAFALYLQTGAKDESGLKPLAELDKRIEETRERLRIAEGGIAGLRVRPIERGTLRERHAQVLALASSRYYARTDLESLTGDRRLLRLRYIIAMYGSTAVSFFLVVLAMMELALLYQLFYGIHEISIVLFLVPAILALLGIISVTQVAAHPSDPYCAKAGLRVHGTIVFGINLVGGMALLMAAYIVLFVVG